MTHRSPSESRNRSRGPRDRPRVETVDDALQQLIADRQRDEDQAEIQDRLEQLYREVGGDGIDEDEVEGDDENDEDEA